MTGYASGYESISPRNCYQDGQSTNCGINQRVLEVARAGGRVGFYVHAAHERTSITTRHPDVLVGWNPERRGEQKGMARKENTCGKDASKRDDQNGISSGET
jgi:hypothetical protein